VRLALWTTSGTDYAVSMRILVGVGGFLWFCMAACVGDDPVGSVPAGSSSGGPDSGLGGSSGAGPNDPDASQPDGAVDPQLLRAVSVSAGASHTCAVLEGGGVACWGSNANGELGSPATSLGASSVPVRVSLSARATQVTAGDRFTCAVLESGKVDCWGNNEFGQLGRVPLGPAGGVGEVVEPPADTRGPWKTPIVLSAGSSHVCATVPGAYAIPIGAVVNYGWCWGKNSARQLLRDTNFALSAEPLLAALDGTEAPVYADTVVSGADFSCAKAHLPFPSGAVARGIQCWGANGKHQLGKALDAPNTFLGQPARSGDPYLPNPTLLTAGAVHACAVADAVGGGTALYCWGDGSNGAIGTVTSTDASGAPHEVTGVEAAAITHLAAGGNDTCIVAAGIVRCMGAGQSGQLGDGTLDANPHPTWSTVDVPPTVSSLSVGGEHVCAVFGGAARQPGDVRCWGANRAGQLGDGLDLNAGYADSPEQKFIRATPVSVRAARP